MTEAGIHINTFDRDHWFKLLGEATAILLNCDRKSFQIATIGAFILPFAKLGQLQVIYGYNRYPSAYITFGYLTDDAVRSLAKRPNILIDIDDLNAGDNLVIFDIVSVLGDFRHVTKMIRELVGERCNGFYGIRYDKTARKLVLKHYRRPRRSS